MEKALPALIRFVREHPTARFYAGRWGTVSAFESLPLFSRKELASAPMASRRYKEGGGIAQVLKGADGPFFIEWSYADIAAELYGTQAARPLVYFADSYESLTAAVWCYEHNMVPLIGEKSAAVVMHAAGAYQIDSLLCDGRSLMALEPYLAARGAPLKSISVLDEVFAPRARELAAAHAKSVRLVLMLPEAGAFAESTPREYPAFRTLPHCLLEESSGELVLTKTHNLVTPIIRYATGIAGSVSHGGGTTALILK